MLSAVGGGLPAFSEDSIPFADAAGELIEDAALQFDPGAETLSTTAVSVVDVAASGVVGTVDVLASGTVEGANVSATVDVEAPLVKTEKVQSTGDLLFDTPAEKTVELSTSVYKDWNFSITTLGRTNGNRPSIIPFAGTGIEIAAFDNGPGLEEASHHIELDHDWDEGSVLSPHIHWYPNSTDTGNVVFQLEYWISGFDLVVGASTTIQVVTAARGSAWQLTLAVFPDIPTVGFSIGSQLNFRLFRDPTLGTDTYTGDAAASTFGFHYRLNTMGSRQIGTK